MKHRNTFKLTRAAMLLLAMLFGLTGARATIVTIGEGTNTNNNVPICTLYNYSFTEQLYTSVEMETGGTITSISFYFALSLAKNFPIDVYMTNTDAEDLQSAFIGVTDDDLVFSGTLSVSGEGWATITLDIPFEYDGASNLLIAVNKGSDEWFSGNSWRYTNAPGMVRYVRNDYNPYTLTNGLPTGSSTNTRPNIQIDISPSDNYVERPTTLTATEITAHEATLTWTGGTGTYNVEYKKKTDEDWTVAATGTTETTLDLTGLTQDTGYQARVQSVGEGDATSGWRSVRFTTLVSCPAPTDLAVDVCTVNSVTLSWTENGEATAWQICLDDDEDNPIDANSNPFTIEGLTAETVYTAKVRAVGNGEYSNWSSAVSFEPTAKIIIGSGTATTYNLPSNTYYNYSLTQQIYTAEELGSTTDAILSIDFYNTSESCTRNLDIYMVSTDKTSFESQSDWVPVTADDLVFSGNVTFAQNVWTTIELDKPFMYDGTSNVVLVVDDNTGSYDDTSYFRVFDAESQAICVYYDYDNFDPFSPPSEHDKLALLNEKNQIRLLFGEPPSIMRPKDLTATPKALSVELSWTERGTATAWQICLNDDEDNLIDVSTNPYTLEGLTPETTYTVKVRSYYDSETCSDWTSNISFTTNELWLAPTDFATSEIAPHSVKLSWTEKGAATEWVVAYKEASEENYTEIVTSENPLTLTGLTQETTYSVKVRPVADEASIIKWSLEESFTTLVSCPAPTDLAVDAYTINSATLSWTENGEATAWQICFDDDEDNPIDVNSNPFTIEGLTAETVYTAKVRAVGQGEYSNWSSSVSFEPTAKTVIGSGTATTYYLPTYTYYNYSLTQQIYTAEELGSAAGAILSIDFYDTSVSRTRNLDIYMVSTDKTSFESKSDWVPVTANDLVFSGDVTFEQNVWTTIELDIPFVFDGTSNVVLVVNDNTGSYETTSYFRVFDAESQAICVYYDYDNFDPFSPPSEHDKLALLNVKNQIRLLFGEPQALARTTALVATPYPHSVELSWTENGTATAWQICLNDDESNLIDADSNPFTLTGLEPETEYTVKVRATNGSDVGYWSKSVTFTTPAPIDAPVELAATDIKATTATLNWTGYQDSYILQYRPAAILEAAMEQDFENLYGDWQASSNNTTNDVAIIDSYGINGSYCFRFSAFTNIADNIQYLISPELNSFSLLEFYYRAHSSSYPETFMVGYSFTGNTEEDFTWGDEITSNTTEWTKFEEAIPEGTKYIAIKYVSVDECYLYIDDITIWDIAIPAGEWQTVNDVTSPQEITGLAPDTKYDWQVQGNLTEGTTAWSEMSSFTTLEAAASVTIGAAGYATYVAPSDVSFPSDVTAFIITATTESSVVMEAVDAIPAGTAVVVKGDAGTYYLDAAASTDDVDSNLLQACTEAFNPTAENTIYCLANKTKGVGFYPVATSVTIPAGKAYLEITSKAKAFYGFFEDDATSINELRVKDEESSIYNLAGQRISKAQKGINIVNGKKILK